MFVHLRKYIGDRFGGPVWEAILGAAQLGPRAYLPIKSYPDEELSAIVTAAARTWRPSG